MFVIKSRKSSIEIEKRQWDLFTVTASDYTVEIPLLFNQVYDIRKQMNEEGYALTAPDGYRIQLWITKEIEKLLK